MSADMVAAINSDNPPEVRPTNPANRTHIDPMVRLAASANDFLHHRVAIRRAGRAVDIVLETQNVADPLAEEDLIQMLSPAINGHTDAKEQGVHVQYLTADERLVLPLYISPKAVDDVQLTRVAESFVAVSALAQSPIARVLSVLEDIASGDEVKDPAEKALFDSIPAPLRATVRMGQQRVYLGTGGRASFRVPAGAGDIATPEEQEVLADTITMSVYSVTGGAVPMPFVFVHNSDIDFISVRFAHMAGLNADPRDFAELRQGYMRLADNAFHGDDPIPLARFQSKLQAFTVSSIAALNYSRLKDIPLLAWTRAYLTSAGVLADSSSKTHSEVAYTQTRPSKSIVQKLSSYHDRDSQRVLLAAYSVGALFGLEHLARDHTFRGGDEALLRVNKAYENALKTVLSDGEETTLAANRHETHRLTCHPFGISQCYSLALWGAHHHRIAEALQIRENVCPPALNRISLAVGVFRQVCSLPVGGIIKSIFGDDHAIADTYMKHLGKRRSEYSALAHLYGWDKPAKVDVRVLDAVNRMMPMLAGYAEAFHTTDPKTGVQRLSGAALAASINNIKRDNGALVSLFSGLFTKYIEASKEQGLEQFLINQRNAIRLAMGGAGAAEVDGFQVVQG